MTKINSLSKDVDVLRLFHRTTAGRDELLDGIGKLTLLGEHLTPEEWRCLLTWSGKVVV